jgi:hypothetical protein
MALHTVDPSILPHIMVVAAMVTVVPAILITGLPAIILAIIPVRMDDSISTLLPPNATKLGLRAQALTRILHHQPKGMDMAKDLVLRMVGMDRDPRLVVVAMVLRRVDMDKDKDPRLVDMDRDPRLVDMDRDLHLVVVVKVLRLDMDRDPRLVVTGSNKVSVAFKSNKNSQSSLSLVLQAKEPRPREVSRKGNKLFLPAGLASLTMASQRRASSRGR